MTAYQSLFRFNKELPTDVKTVLILGPAGGVGSMAIQLLKAKTNVTVIATASKPQIQNLLKELREYIIVYHHSDVIKQLKEEGINQVDFVFAANGLKNAISWLPELIKPYGYLAPIEGLTDIDLWPLMNKFVTVLLEMVFSKSILGVIQESQGAIIRELIGL